MKYGVRNEAGLASAKVVAILAASTLALGGCISGGGGGGGGSSKGVSSVSGLQFVSNAGISSGGITTIVTPEANSVHVAVKDAKIDSLNDLTKGRYVGATSRNVGAVTSYNSGKSTLTIDSHGLGPLEGSTKATSDGVVKAIISQGNKAVSVNASNIGSADLSSFDPNKPITLNTYSYFEARPQPSYQYTKLGVVEQIVGDLVFNSSRTAYDFDKSRFSYARGYSFDGVDTSTSDMNSLASSNVTASYTGFFVGDRSLESNGVSLVDQDRLSANMNMSANFGAGTVSGSTSNLATVGGSSLGYGIEFSGDISGNRFDGDANFTAGSTNPGTGSVIGGFYGPGAAEVVGVTQVYKSSVNGQKTTIQGTIAGKKN